MKLAFAALFPLTSALIYSEQMYPLGNFAAALQNYAQAFPGALPYLQQYAQSTFEQAGPWLTGFQRHGGGALTAGQFNIDAAARAGQQYGSGHAQFNLNQQLAATPRDYFGSGASAQFIPASSARPSAGPSTPQVSALQQGPANTQAQPSHVDLFDFTSTYPDPDTPNAQWSYVDLAALNFTSRGGTLTPGCDGGAVTANPYFLKYPQGRLGNQFNSVKYFLENSKPYVVPTGGKLVVECVLQAETFNTDRSPFPANIVNTNDARLAAGGLFLHDWAHDLSFDWILTNDRVYARYARDAAPGSSTGGYAGFAYLVPVVERQPCDSHSLRIEVDGASREVRYYVGDRPVLIIGRVGFRMADPTYMTLDLGGEERDVFPSQLNVGIGASTQLHNYPACKDLPRSTSALSADCGAPPVRMALVDQAGAAGPPTYSPLAGPPAPAQYYDTQMLPQNLLWGQGSTMRLHRLAAWTA